MALPPRLRRKTKVPDGRMPVLDHLRELRRRIIVIVLIVVVGAIVGWVFYNHILEFLKHPYCEVPWQHRLGGKPHDGNHCKLIFTGPLDGFTSRLKISVIAGIVLTGPFWLYQIWGFITPGLRKAERKYTLVFIFFSTVLFAAGVALAYLIVSRGLRFVIEQAGSGTQANLSINSYVSFIVLVLVVFGAAFELPLLVVLANFAGVLPAKLLKKSQRISIFLIFLFAAVATPSTDPFTMCAMAVPLVILFEVAVVVATVHDRRKARRKAAEQAAALDDDVASSIDPIPRPIEAERLESGTSTWSDST